MCCAERKRREQEAQQEARQTKFYALVFGVYVLFVVSLVGGAWYLGS